MGRLCRETTDYQAIDFAFDHVDEMARLLHRSGHRDLAALLDCMGDLRELSRRRADDGGRASLIGASSDTVDYVLAQMSELAELMARSGAADAALLFRVPGQLRNASEAREHSMLARLRDPKATPLQDNLAVRQPFGAFALRPKAASDQRVRPRGWA